MELKGVCGSLKGNKSVGPWKVGVAAFLTHQCFCRHTRGCLHNCDGLLETSLVWADVVHALETLKSTGSPSLAQQGNLKDFTPFPQTTFQV